MPHPYHLVTAALVTRSELLEFILEQGGSKDPEGIYDAEVRGGAGVVWVTWDTGREEEHFRGLDDYLDSELGIQSKRDAIKSLGIITEKLGAPPKTYVLLDVLKSRPSERLALRLIKAFSKRWGPCILDNLKPPGVAWSGQEIWTVEELLAFSGSHGGLPQ